MRQPAYFRSTIPRGQILRLESNDLGGAIVSSVLGLTRSACQLSAARPPLRAAARVLADRAVRWW